MYEANNIKSKKVLNFMIRVSIFNFIYRVLLLHGIFPQI